MDNQIKNKKLCNYVNIGIYNTIPQKSEMKWKRSFIDESLNMKYYFMFQINDSYNFSMTNARFFHD